MTITTSDIKLLKAERLTDFVDGGGRMTGNEVVDGVVNNLFGDISHLDRVYGRVSLRKAFFSVQTANTDTLYGAMALITDPPGDDSVHVLLFSTSSWVDERSAARVRIENYRIKGVTSRFVLYGLHPAGMRQIQVYCLAETASPDINDVLCLAVETGPATGQEQFVKVQRVISRSTQTFIDDSGAFQRDVLQIELTAALGADYEGRAEPARRTGDYPPTRIRLTQVADAASYYSIRPTTTTTLTGATRVDIGTPFVPLVPSTLAETAVTDLLAGMGYAAYVQSGALNALTMSSSTTTIAAGAELTRYFGTAFARGSLSITQPATLVDDGNGVLTGTAGWSGTVDYAGGSFTLSRTSSWSGSIVASATPAGVLVAQSASRIIRITGGNRQYSYVDSVVPLPQPGTLLVDYRALGKWIRLRDNGAGQISGEQAGQGTGTINYATGSLAITLPVLPDVDSAIIISTGTPKQASRRDGDTAIEAPRVLTTLPQVAVKPGTLVIQWTAGGIAKSATDIADGSLTGDATGRVVHSTGEVGFKPAALPDSGTTIRYEYDRLAQQGQTQVLSTGGGDTITFTVTGPIRPGTFRARWQGIDTGTPTSLLGVFRRPIEIEAYDNGVGGIFVRSAVGTAYGGFGTINYTTGEVTIQVEFTEPAFVPQYAPQRHGNRTCMYVSGYTLENIGIVFEDSTPVVLNWVLDSATDDAVVHEIEAPPVRIDLTPGVVDAVVPGSVRFTFRSRTYVDRIGTLYYGVDAANNAGTPAGTINYATGQCVITDYTAGGTNSIAIQSLMTVLREPGTSNIFARTPGAPLRPGSFTIRANKLDGTLITGSADINGVITGDEMSGTVDWQTGVFDVVFGELVTAAGNESAPWYNVAWVSGGQIWRPTQVLPGSVYVNTVVYRNVPLEASLLGLDPVRLPDDGRVQAFKPGGVALLHHTGVVSVSPSAGQTVSLGRTLVDFVEVRDSADVPVLSSWYTIDRDAGEVVFEDPLNLAAYTLPLKIRHTIAHLCVISDVQITGEVDITPPTTRQFATGSYLSGCLVAPGADLQGRVAGVFEQATWTGVWSDTRIGDAPASASFNNAVYPITLTNEGAITERWALVFTNTSQFSVVGEAYGVVGTGSILSDTTINNPATGAPLFVVDKDAFGAGWASGNVVRFNTIGAGFPIWIARTTLAGPVETPADQFRIRMMGDST